MIASTGSSFALLPSRALLWFARGAAILRRIIGAPDYSSYVAHLRSHHPGREPLCEQEFVEDRLRARYEQVGSRCC